VRRLIIRSTVSFSSFPRFHDLLIEIVPDTLEPMLRESAGGGWMVMIGSAGSVVGVAGCFVLWTSRS
jgi:hypothetical protein